MKKVSRIMFIVFFLIAFFSTSVVRVSADVVSFPSFSLKNGITINVIDEYELGYMYGYFSRDTSRNDSYDEDVAIINGIPKLKEKIDNPQKRMLVEHVENNFYYIGHFCENKGNSTSSRNYYQPFEFKIGVVVDSNLYISKTFYANQGIITIDVMIEEGNVTFKYDVKKEYSCSMFRNNSLFGLIVFPTLTILALSRKER